MYRPSDAQRLFLQPSLDCVKDVEPTFVYKDQPSNVFTSKYVESRENKPEARPVNALCVRIFCGKLFEFENINFSGLLKGKD